MIQRFTIFCCIFFSTQVFAQQFVPSMEQFGKNRIQFRLFDWKVITSANFEIYFYQNGQPAATLAAQYAESEFDRVTDLLGYTPSDRIKIFIYNSAQDLNQSNLGLGSPEDDSPKLINLQKSRVEIAFPGNQIDFKRQIIKGISSLYVYDMLYGGNVKEILQNSLLLSLPEWYIDGMANYLTDGWNADADNAMRDMILNKRLKKLSNMSGSEAGIAGQSVWSYIADRYGKDNISNILNLTRIIRNDQTSIASTLGVNFNRFLKEWREYYTSQATSVSENYQDFKLLNKIDGNTLEEGYKLKKLALSPDQHFLAFTSNEHGHYVVEVQNLQNNKRYTVLKGGQKRTGQVLSGSSPIVSWQKNNNLAVIFEDKNRVLLEVYTVDEKGGSKLKTKREFKEIDQVNDFDISEDGTFLALSASKKGQNDLFLYKVNGNVLVQLTNDFFDDRFPQFLGASNSQMVFSSNRIADSLGLEKGNYKNIKNAFGLYLHDGSSKTLKVSNLADSLGRITSVVVHNDKDIFFLSDEKGIRNLYRYSLADSSLRQMTSLKLGVNDFDINPTSGNLYYLTVVNALELICNQRIQFDKNIDVPPTYLAVKSGTQFNKQFGINASEVVLPEPAKNQKIVEPTKISNANPLAIKLEKGEVDTDNYSFENEVFKSIEPKKEKSNNRNSSPSSLIKPAKRENFKIKGPIDYENAAVLNGSMGTPASDPLPMRGLGWKQTFSLNDLLENHLIRGGIYTTLNLRNTDWFGEYHYLPHRIDFSARYDRRTLFVESEVNTEKYRFNQISLSASYPISEVSRIKLSPFYALTRGIELEKQSIADKVSDFSGAVAEYVFDNTVSEGMNRLQGTRAKIKYAYYKGLSSSNESFDRLTIDIRNYTKINKGIIFASRISFSTSAGQAPKPVSLGGIDNWLSPTRDSHVQSDALNPANKSDLFFTDFATTMRGFNINKQSGTSHLLLNFELRVPIAEYLSSGPVTSNFLKNLQFTVFSDIGTTWSEKGPLAIRYDYPITTTAGSRNYFNAAVNTFKNPFLLGYGLGLRTTLFGYYAKFDTGWGMENKDVQKPIMYLTIGYDF